MPEQLRLDLTNYSGDVVATTNRFTGLSFTSIFSGKGTMQVTLPAENPVALLSQDDFIHRVWYKYPEKGIGWINIFNGIQKTVLDSLTEIGRRTKVIHCPSEEEMFQKSHVLYKAGTSQASKSGVCSTVAYQYVKENIGEDALTLNGRIVDGTNPILLGNDYAEGPIWNGSRAYKNLLDVMKDIRKFSIEQNDQIDFRATYQDGYVFLVEIGKIGADRTTIGLNSTSNGRNSAGNSPIIFTQNRANLKALNVSLSKYDASNVVVGLGTGENSDRITAVAQNSIGRNISPIAQRESIASGTDQSSLAGVETLACEKLQARSPRKKVNAHPRSGSDILYRDYFLGDFVTVEDFDGNRITKQVLSITITSSADNNEAVTKKVNLSDE